MTATTTTTAPRIYVACLASYNNGALHGRWIDASTDVDAMQAEISAILRESKFPNVVRQDYVDAEGARHCVDVNTAAKHIPDDWTKDGAPYASAEEWAIHDHEGLGSGLGEYAGLAEVARRVAIVEAAEESNIPPAVLIDAMSDMGADDKDPDEFISDQFDGTASTWADFAAERIEDTESELLDKLPAWLSCHIDWDGVGRDWECSGDWSAYRDGDFGELYFFRNC